MELLFSKIDQLIILKTLIVSISGFVVFYIHSITIYNYLRSLSYVLTSILLPPIALIITTVISSNLALSLGMIGALSIVRYRTPIKSVYELALLFFLITLGVAGGVSIKYAIFLAIFLIFTPLFVRLLMKFKLFDIVNSQHSIEDKYFEALFVFENSYKEIQSNIDLNDKIINFDENFIDQKKTEITLRFDSLSDFNLFKDSLEKYKNLNVLNVSVNKRG
tara:strand:- start:3886 stop:4545 length:660 start_codon:yes stop_codon:yes gene_type:complete